MGTKTGIEWTDVTWNPIRGCSRVSEGCRNCYAERVAYRFSGSGQPYEGLAHFVNGHPTWTGKVSLVEKHLLDPLKWRGRKLYHPDHPRSVGSEPGMRIFVNSMSDLFHENVTDEMRDRIFAVMALCPQHTFQVLTKRPAEMLRYLDYHFRVVSPGPRERIFGVVQKMPGYDPEHPKWLRIACEAFKGDSRGVLPLPNVWLGVSVENQATADERIPLLLQTPAAVRFISAEPLLGPVDLTFCQHRREFEVNTLTGDHGVYRPLRGRSDKKLDWVIVGGESGPGARPMHPDWARSLRDQCHAAGVAFFMKQMGSVYGPRKGHELPPDLDVKQFPGEDA